MKRSRASTRAAHEFQLPGWDRLRHGGLLFDAARAAELAKFVPKQPLTGLVESRFRRLADALGESKDAAAASRFVSYTLDEVSVSPAPAAGRAATRFPRRKAAAPSPANWRSRVPCGPAATAPASRCSSTGASASASARAAAR